jgi:hypothetical protein
MTTIDERLIDDDLFSNNLVLCHSTVHLSSAQFRLEGKSDGSELSHLEG